MADTTTTAQDAETNVTSKKSSRQSLASVDRNNVGTLRKLLSVILPVVYTERFYAEVILPEVADYCQLIYYNDIPVGAVCCRLEQVDAASKESKLYIMTMGVLAPYRSQGLGTAAIKHLINAALPSSTSSNKTYIKSLYLHVQVSNDSAKRFYERSGFKETSVVNDYYKKIEPKAAWLMEYEMPPRPTPPAEGAEDGTAAAAGSKPGKGADAKQGGGAKNQGHGKGGKKRR